MSNNQLPADVQERIKADADAATNKEADRLRETTQAYDRMISQLHGYELGYIAGATAEANFTKSAITLLGTMVSRFEGAAYMADQDYDKGLITKCKKLIQQWKEGKDNSQAKDKGGLIRLILAGAAEVSRDVKSAEEYLKREGIDVVEVKNNAHFIAWKAELIKLTKEKTGESTIKINDTEARKWFDDGATPYQTFRETWNME